MVCNVHKVEISLKMGGFTAPKLMHIELCFSDFIPPLFRNPPPPPVYELFSHFSGAWLTFTWKFNLNRKAVHSLVATTVVKVAIPQARQCPVKGPPKGTEALRPPSVCTAPLFFLFYGIVGRSSHWHLKKRNWGGTKCCWGIHPTSRHNTAWQNPCPSQIFWLFDLSFISRLESSIIHY